MSDPVSTNNGGVLGYSVLNTDRNEFVPQLGSGPLGSDEELFQTEAAAKEHLTEHTTEDTTYLKVVAVRSLEDTTPPEHILTGEVIEYDHQPHQIIAYVRVGTDMYRVNYTFDSFSRAENYSPL